MYARRLLLLLSPVFLLGLGGLVLWATTPCGELGGSGRSCPDGPMRLASTYCLGATWSKCYDAHFNTITISFDSGPGFWGTYVGAEESLSANVMPETVRVQIDGGAWYGIWNSNPYFMLAPGTHTFRFWSRPTNRDSTGRLCVFVCVGNLENPYQRCVFGWENKPRVSGNPFECPDPACP